MTLRARWPALVADAFASEDDRALVRRFVESRDEVAFAAIVTRHARMVYGVCRRAVHDAHLAEDAFQAVFLVLANHPGRALAASAVGGWLFGVARRVGAAVRRREERFARRQTKVNRVCGQREAPDFDELLRVLDEELAGLAEEYRGPLVACFLEERTLDEAARQLSWSVSTLRRRLDRGKELLRTRLARRGITFSAGLFAGFLAPSAQAAVPPRLIESALPSARPAPLAATLAADFARGSLLFPASLAVVVMALGLGGAVLAFNGETGAPVLPIVSSLPDARSVVPASQSASQAEGRWVRLRGRVIYPDSPALPAKRAVPFDRIKDAEFFGPQSYGDVLIDPQTRGIANAVVWLRPDTEDEHAAFPADRIHPAFNRKPVDRPIQATREGFSPRITVARPGDRLVFSNPTPVVLTVCYDSAAGMDRRFNVFLPPGRVHTTAPLSAARTSDSFSDSIHSWIRGYAWVFDHPYVAVTDASGGFEMRNTPIGSWRFVVWHEKAGYREGMKLGQRLVIPPDGTLKPLAFSSPNWDD